jgi:hypothetical protein
MPGSISRVASFIHKPTGKTIWRLSSREGSQYFWNKLKQETLNFLVKEKDFNAHEIEIHDENIEKKQVESDDQLLKTGV